MKILKKKLVVKSKQDYYSKHLEIIRPFLPVTLTNKEIEILSCFMSLDIENKFSTEGRKKVKSMIDKLSDGGLGNYLRDFKKKSIVLSDKTGNLYIHSILFPSDNSKQEYEYNIELS